MVRMVGKSLSSAAELYRDPIYDGATDPLVVIDDAGDWWMFYTQRRATHPDPGPGVSWVHGSRIGVARSADGVEWAYAGVLEPDEEGLVLSAAPPPRTASETHWAPEVVNDGTGWRMYLTEINGIPDRWPGFARSIVEYRSDDLRHWRRHGPLALSSDRVIDAAVARTPDGRWRLWYKDEAADSVTMVAASEDLDDWVADGVAIGGRPHEGPSAFALGGWWWMIVDEWRGMGVYRSTDAVNWHRQGDEDAVVLGRGEVPGPEFGHHGAPVRDGDEHWYYYFGFPVDALDKGGAPLDSRLSAIYRVRLLVEGDALVLR